MATASRCSGCRRLAAAGPGVDRPLARGWPAAAGALIMRLVREGMRPRADFTRGAFRECHRLGLAHRRLHQRGAAPARDRARGRGSARPADLQWHQRLGPRCSPIPSRPAGSCHGHATAPVASRARARRLARLRRARAGRPDRDGRTISDVAEAASEPARPDGDPSARSAAVSRRAVSTILHGNLAPDGCVVKVAGHTRQSHRGPAQVFEGEEAAFAAVQAGADPAERRRGHPQRGPEGRARHARDARRHGGDCRGGPRRDRRPVTDGRFSGATHGLDDRSRRAGGGAPAARSGASHDGDIDPHRRRGRRLDFDVDGRRPRRPARCVVSAAAEGQPGRMANYAARVSARRPRARSRDSDSRDRLFPENAEGPGSEQHGGIMERLTGAEFCGTVWSRRGQRRLRLPRRGDPSRLRRDAGRIRFGTSWCATSRARRTWRTATRARPAGSAWRSRRAGRARRTWSPALPPP